MIMNRPFRPDERELAADVLGCSASAAAMGECIPFGSLLDMSDRYVYALACAAYAAVVDAVPKGVNGWRPRGTTCETLAEAEAWIRDGWNPDWAIVEEPLP